MPIHWINLLSIIGLVRLSRIISRGEKMNELNENDLKTAIAAKARELVLLACSKYSIPTKPLDLRLDMTGGRGGSAGYNPDSKRFYLRFNLELALKNQDEFLNQVIGHEVSHIIDFWKHGNFSRPDWWRDIEFSHGRNWQVIMITCFSLVPDRCHSMDTSQTSSKMARNFIYSCNCREHRLTSILHKRVMAGQHRICSSCRSRLVYVETKSSISSLDNFFGEE
jgi:SprT protein